MAAGRGRHLLSPSSRALWAAPRPPAVLFPHTIPPRKGWQEPPPPPSASGHTAVLAVRHLFCVVTTTVVFVGAGAGGLLDFFHRKGSRTATRASSALTTPTSRMRPMRKLEKQRSSSSLQRPAVLGQTRHVSRGLREQRRGLCGQTPSWLVMLLQEKGLSTTTTPCVPKRSPL